MNGHPETFRNTENTTNAPRVSQPARAVTRIHARHFGLPAGKRSKIASNPKTNPNVTPSKNKGFMRTEVAKSPFKKAKNARVPPHPAQ